MRALAGLLNLVFWLGVTLFLPAWTFRYWQAWLFLGVFTGCVLAITLHLLKHDPELLSRRMRAGAMAETQKRQKVIQAVASVAFVAMFIVPALDHRFKWSAVPYYAVAAGDALVVLGLYIVFRVFKENSFTSATIEVGIRQPVVSTGPYAVVRHPMYAGSLVMLLGVPVALGSWRGLLVMVPMALTIVWRLLDEERFLIEELAGYAEYRERVRYRLLPGLW